MKKESKWYFMAGICLLLLFVVWTVAVSFVDVKPIGPKGSSVGFATLNGAVHSLVGVNWGLYAVTDWLGLVPFGIAAGYGALGLAQLIKRKSLFKVDRGILFLGIFYAAVIFVFVLFEYLEINYRPVLIDGVLEASYPSSTTMISMCVMPTAAIELYGRINNRTARLLAVALISVFTAFMVIGRLISGVHWISDIIGGAFVSAGLVLLYCFSLKQFKK